MIATAPVRHYPTIDSTNLEARRLTEAGERGPLWLLADEQTGGRGRLGRNWQSPVGNLYSTLLLTLDVPLSCVPQVGFVVALAVHDVASALVPQKSIHLKWPNDCLVNGGKVAGILSETLSISPIVVAVGCGINIGFAPVGLQYPAARLDEADVAAVFDHYRQALEARLTQWQGGIGFADIARDWSERAIGMGELVSISDSTGTHSGIFSGLASDGALLIELATGPQRFYAGDVTIPSLEKLRSIHP